MHGIFCVYASLSISFRFFFRLSMSCAVRDDLSVQCSSETTSIGQRDHYFVYFWTAPETASAWLLKEFALSDAILSGGNT